MRPDGRAWSCALGLAAAAGIACAPAAWAQMELSRTAEPGGVRPEGSGRLVRVFGFDEAPGPGIPVPAGWYRGQADPTIPREREGFPVWNGATLDFAAPAFRGRGSIRLPTEGGSTSLVLREGMAAVFPQADYRVTARVRTDGLVHALAGIEVRVLDQAGVAIPGTSVRSALVQPRGAWAEIHADILGEHPEAAFLQIELLLLQPREQTDRSPRPFEVWEQDFSGAAWFDEVTITQLPRMELATQADAQLVRSPEVPELHVRVRDLAGEDLLAQWRVLDARGRVVARHDVGPFTGRLETSWRPRLPSLGWYRAEVRLLGPSGEAARASCAFAWIDARAEDETRDGLGRAREPAVLGVETSSADPRVVDALPSVTEAVGATAATVPIWPAGLRATTAEWAADIARAVDAALVQGVDVTLSLDEAPPTLSTSTAIVADDTLSLLAADDRTWEAEAIEALDRFGQRVRRWRAGPADGGDGLWLPGTPARAKRALAALSRLVPGPSVTVPWRADADLPLGSARVGRTTAVRLGPGAGEDATEAVVAEWLADAADARTDTAADPTDLPRLEISIDGEGEPGVAPRAQAARAVRTALAARAAWDAAAGDDLRISVILADAWSLTESRRPVAQPTAALTAWASLASRLEGRRVERVDLGEGVTALLFSPRDEQAEQQGADGAIAWWRTGVQAPAELTVALGDGPLEIVDLFGNQAPAVLASEDSPTPGAALLPVDDEPRFAEGVDAALVRLLASLRLEPGMLRSRAEPQAHRIVFANPFGVPLRGRLTVLEPGGYSVPGGRIDRSWRVEPRSMPFVLGPGEMAELPVEIEFSPAEESGPKRFVFEVELTGRSAPMRVVRTVELGLPELELRVSARPAPAGASGVAVVAEVTNLAREARDLELVAVAPGIARERASIAGLRPGETATRVFVLRAPADELRGRRVSVGVVLPEGDERLTKSVVIE